MEHNDKRFIINSLLFILLLSIIGWASHSFITPDFEIVFKWYFLSILFTIVGFPLSSVIFKRFHDKGYIFAKILGFLVPGYMMWLLSSVRVLKFNYVNSLICLLVFGIISYVIWILVNRKKKEYFRELKDTLVVFYRIEVFVLILFLLACYVKSFNPDANSAEKYMDYGFMNIINKTDYMVPNDLWLAGEKINYYYFGHYIATYIIKLSTFDVNYGYNLILVSLFVMASFSAYTLGFNLHYIYSKNKKKSYVGGIIGLLALSLAGNFHYVIFNIIKPLIETLLHLKVDTVYSFYDSTRYIGYNPETVDKVIHEFPMFSFILGDLHSHVLDILFVLLLLALLFVYLLSKKEIVDKVNLDDFKVKLKATSKNSLNLINISLGFILGIMKMTNYWDYPIYMVVVLVMFIISDIIIYKNYKDVILMNIYRLLVILIVSSLVSLPFTLSFVKIASKIALVPFRSIFYQLLVLWGLPSILVLYYFAIFIKDRFKLVKNKYNLKCYIEKANICDLFIIVIGFCAIGLVIAPEIIYVVDIYYDSIPRFNTVFKFTYQSFILFSICYGYILIRLISEENITRQKIGKIMMFLFLLTCGYAYTGISQWFGDVTVKDYYKTLDAREFLERSELNDPSISTLDNLAVINYINNNTPEDVIILEACGDSFSSDNQISTFTGRRTVLGWSGHEWLWRSENSNFDYPQIVAEHEDDVNTLYHETDKDVLIDLIKKYDINYIVVGYTERIKYGSLVDGLDNENELKELGDIVFVTNENDLDLETYVIKVYEDL